MHGIRSFWGRSIFIVLMLSGMMALLWGLLGSSAVLYNRVNGAEIMLRVEQRLALHPWDCVTVSWRVLNIEKVFFDDDATVGEAMTRYCPHNASYPNPTLYVDFQNNFIQRYTIPVLVLTDQWWFWTGLIALVVYGYVSFGPWVGDDRDNAAAIPGMSRRAFVLGMGGTVMLVVVGARMRLPMTSQVVILDDGWVVLAEETKAP